jgi:hypothetical protein
MRLLGLARAEDDRIKLSVSIVGASDHFEEWFRSNLRERLRRNRLVSRISEELETREQLTLVEVADLLSAANPYISASRQTWRQYARTFADWMDTTDLAILNSSKGTLSRYKPRTELRARRVLPSRRRSGLALPRIQYSPIERAALRLAEALERENRLDWSGFEQSTVTKALASLEELGFISRTAQTIEVLPRGLEFCSFPNRRADLFAEGALKMTSFATFVEILNEYREHGLGLHALSAETKSRLGADWTDGTAEVNTKIMLDWARHANLAPPVFEKGGRPRSNSYGPRWRMQMTGQRTLFDDV